MPNESRAPDLAELLDLAVERGLLRVNTWMPGRIDSYDATKQTATVVPELTLRAAAQDGSEAALVPPKLVDVPVVFPGAGGFRLTFPLAQGDRVMLVFAQRSLDEWKTAAGAVDPADERHHDITDAVALVGLHDFLSVWTSVPTDRMTLGKDAGAQIAVGPSIIEIGYPSASDAAARSSRVDAELAALKSAFDGHVHTSGGSGSPTTTPTIPAPSQATTASGTVKISP